MPRSRSEFALSFIFIIAMALAGWHMGGIHAGADHKMWENTAYKPGVLNTQVPFKAS